MKISKIDWTRVAEPQTDEYGVVVAEILAKDRYGWTKKWPEDHHSTWLEQAVRVKKSNSDHDDILAAAEEFLKVAWPELYRDLRRLLQVVKVEWQGEVIDPLKTGCSCGPLVDHISMQVQVITSGGIGLLEGVVHEYAHNLMKFHGISFFHWERHLTNLEATQEEIDSAPPKGSPQGPKLFDSPIVKTRQRPMGACLSAWYSYVFVAQLLINLREADCVGDELHDWIRTQRDRVAEGIRLIHDHVEYDDTGEAYFGSLLDWAGRVAKEADSICED